MTNPIDTDFPGEIVGRHTAREVDEGGSAPLHSWWGREPGVSASRAAITTALPRASIRADKRPVVLDPFAGTGSTVAAALTVGCDAIGCDIDDVATRTMLASLVTPATMGATWTTEVQVWGERWVSGVADRMSEVGEGHVGPLVSLWVLTVPCPWTGKATPLDPRPALDRDLVVDAVLGDGGDIAWAIRTAVGAARTTRVYRGRFKSVHVDREFDESHVAQMASEGRIRAHIACCVDRRSAGLAFRTPTDTDLAFVRGMRLYARRQQTAWRKGGLLATALLPRSKATRPALLLGRRRWYELCSPRQLAANAIVVDELRELIEEMRLALPKTAFEHLRSAMLLVLSSVVERNTMFSGWDAVSLRTLALFDDGHLRPTGMFCEPDVRALLVETLDEFASRAGSHAVASGSAIVLKGSATALPLRNQSVDLVLTGPPYHDAILYGDASSFFRAWWHAVDENLALHGAAESAEVDFDAVLDAASTEMRRVVRPDGRVLVYFSARRLVVIATLLDAGLGVSAIHLIPRRDMDEIARLGRNDVYTQALIVAAVPSKAGTSRPSSGPQRPRYTCPAIDAVFREQADAVLDLAASGDRGGRASWREPIAEAVIGARRASIRRAAAQLFMCAFEESPLEVGTKLFLLTCLLYGTSVVPRAELVAVGESFGIDLGTSLEEAWWADARALTPAGPGGGAELDDEFARAVEALLSSGFSSAAGMTTW